MDTNKLKRFAGEARNILIDGVKQRLSALGIREDGTITEKPELKDGGAVFMGDTQTVDFYDQFESLSNQLKNHSCRDVIEEVAYTWFNRLVAIRIMAKNGLIPPVLEYDSEQDRIPVLVSDARQGRMPQMNEESRQKLEGLLANDALTDAQFQVLIVAYCHGNPIINKCFGTISDYTELLLPSNILKKDGFIDRLNDDDYISDNDYKSPELIGWLYQFYISERKDEVFAKKGKFEADEIPAATQIFTPNWIVKYMVQNTVGRIYLDNNPYSDIKKGMQYLVEPAEPTPADAIYHFDDIHDLTCADLACGSGHILNECFDLLYQIYIEEGYNRRKAIEDIFRYNLTGVDIDTRAKQLATFALLLKACQKDISFVDAHCIPKVYDMPEPYTDKEHLVANIAEFLMARNKEAIQELYDAITLMDEAQNLGSIMKFGISERTRNMMSVRLDEYEKEDVLSEKIIGLMPYMKIILSLTHNYSALVMNPPYMGAGNMNQILKDYIILNFDDAKNDLCNVFMDIAIDKLDKNGKVGIINTQSWAFHSTLQKFRKRYIINFQIDTLLHLGTHTFDELSGEVVQNVSFVISKSAPFKNGAYYNLTEGNNCAAKEKNYKDNIKVPFYSYQIDFLDISECTIAYWISHKEFEILKNNKSLSEVAVPRAGLQTSDNPRFLRLWHEISIKDFGIYLSRKEAISSEYKWFPHNKGGEARKWYGNRMIVINFYHDAEELKYWLEHNPKDPTTTSWSRNLRSYPMYFKEGLTWSAVSNTVAVRWSPQGSTFDTSGPMLFSDNLKYILGLCNSIVFSKFLKIFAQSLSKGSGSFGNVPYISSYEDDILILSAENISISRQDWDAHETSWDFNENELVRLSKIIRVGSAWGDIVPESEMQPQSLSSMVCNYKSIWGDKLRQLHANEEELNRQFINIYGLQDELTPDVPLDEITILQQGEISIEDNAIVWHDDVLMKQLISYAVGCMMGRYSIDKPGLILANQGDGLKEYEALVPNSRFEIDDDGIIPIMPANTEFTDNITLRFKAWLSITFGEDTLIENLNYIEKSLGKRLDDYFVKDFWKYHKKMYQNRPIYWLFSSKKGAFQCIVYMHRMNAYTAEKVRTNYLLPHIEWLINKQSEMQANAADLSTRERKEMDNIGKQIEECREYHDRLHAIADKQIAFDLDDGVVVNYAKFSDVLMKLK